MASFNIEKSKINTTSILASAQSIRKEKGLLSSCRIP